MDFYEALRIVTESHTEDDPEVGFKLVAAGSLHHTTMEEYIKAWETIREYLANKKGLGN